jgi:acetyl-CoA C-acetyltransferase
MVKRRLAAQLGGLLQPLLTAQCPRQGTEFAVYDAVICEPVRTPIGKFGGRLRTVSATELGVTAVRGLVERTALQTHAVDDVIVGQGYGTSEAPNIGRVIALDSELPVTVPGMQIDRRCSSGLQAVLHAAMQVQTGVSDLVIAGGAESMSNASFYSLDIRWGTNGDTARVHNSLGRARTTAGGKFHVIPDGMLETAENLRRQYSISRQEQDELALMSHERAIAAQRSGYFAEEIVPVVFELKGAAVTVDTDEHPRADTSFERLSALKPILVGSDPAATVTAGNASGQNDGAAMCIVTTREKAAELGLRPLVKLVSWAVAGVDPELMGIGPVPATAAALKRAGLTLADIDLIELNEAFAAQALACMREWELSTRDFDRVNVNGSGISLGHPVGATGARMLGALARELERRDLRYGLETMCVGGGQGVAAIFERVR